MTADTIIVRKEDGIGWLVFNNPERHNALSDEMSLATIGALADFEADPAVRLCVMTGAGEKAFISGADIGGLKPGGRAADDAPAPTVAAFQALGAFQKPLLAMIRGWCLGGGVAVAMKADIRICSADARFGIPAARLGAGYPIDCVRDLVNLVGPSAAKAILFAGERFDAAQALRLGLADEVLAPDALEARVRQLAAAIAENAPLTIRAAKAAVDHVARGTGSAAQIAALVADCFASDDFAEGRAAFLEKRAPVFRGR
jgi:enoyl-CoA hydratase/carnithine racemase